MNEKQKTLGTKIDGYLGQLDERLDTWKAKAKEAGDDAREAVQEQLEQLRERRRGLRARLDTLRAAGEDAAEKARATVEEAWDDVKAAAAKVAAHFEDDDDDDAMPGGAGELDAGARRLMVGRARLVASGSIGGLLSARRVFGGAKTEAKDKD